MIHRRIQLHQCYVSKSGSIFRFLIGILLLSSLSSCLTEKSIEFKEVRNIRPERIGQETTINMDVVLYNPNNWGCKINSTQADLLIDDQKIGTARQLDAIQLKPMATVTIPCSFEISGGQLLKLIPSGIQVIFGGKKMTAVTKGSTVAQKFIFRKRISFETKQELNGKMLQSIF